MIKSVTGDGHNSGAGNLANGAGPVVLTELIGDGAEVAEIIPQFVTDLPSAMETSMLTKIFAHEEFGLRFDASTRAWVIILAANIDTTSEFSFAYAGDTSGLKKDASWLIRFKSNGTIYTTSYRGLKYSIESDLETRFYFDSSVKIYNSRTAKTITDQVNILGINAQPDSATAMDRDHIWQIYGLDTGYSGTTNTRRVLVTFLDSDADGIPDNPDQFIQIVAPTVNPNTKSVFFEKFTEESGGEQWRLTTKTVNVTYATATALAVASTTLFTDKEVIYLTTDKAFRVFNKTDSTFLVSTDYKVYTGRKALKFNYKHNSPSDRRINPGLSNIIDMYVLTRAYSNAYTSYVQDNTGTFLAAFTDTTTWHHICVYVHRTPGGGNTFQYGVYLDGAQILWDNATNSNVTLNQTAAPLFIGARMNNSSSADNFFSGYIDEVRWQRGGNPFNCQPNSSRSDTITVPTAAHEAIGNTQLLLHMDGANGATTMKDHSWYNNSVSFFGTAHILSLIHI